MSTGVDLFMPLYYGDFLKDTKWLNLEQKGAYLLLLLNMWNEGGYLPDDPEVLAVIVEVSPERWAAIWSRISHYFTATPNGLTQKRLLKELEAAKERRRIKSAAGSAAAADARAGEAAVDVGGLLGRVVNVVHCARCQGDHTLTFTRLNNPANEYEWWAMCPTVRQPVTMRVDVVGEVFLPFSAAAPYEVHECGLAYDAALPAAGAADVAATDEEGGA